MESAEKRIRELQETKADVLDVNEKHDKLISLVMKKADEVQKLCFTKIDENYEITREEINKSI